MWRLLTRWSSCVLVFPGLLGLTLLHLLPTRALTVHAVFLRCGHRLDAAVTPGQTDLRINGVRGPCFCSDPRDLVRRRCDPLATLPRKYALNVHGVELLESPALAFNDEEVDYKATEEVASREDITVAEVNGGGDEGGEESEQKVPTKSVSEVYIQVMSKEDAHQSQLLAVERARPLPRYREG